MFKKFLAVVAAAVAGGVGWLSGQAHTAKQAVEEFRNAHFAAFVETCPYVRPGVPIGPRTLKGSYLYVYDRKADFDVIVDAFAMNHGITEAQAQECFKGPEKKPAA